MDKHALTCWQAYAERSDGKNENESIERRMKEGIKMNANKA